MREQLGISQSELAKRVGITQAHVAKIEGGRVDARLSTINKILSVLESGRRQVKCKEVMVKTIISLNPEEKVSKAIKLMRKFDISQIPVIEDGRVVGSIKESTIVGNLDKNLARLSVREVMEEPFPIVGAEDSIELVKSLLSFHQAVLVSEKGRIVGIITKSDLLKLVR